MVSWSALLFGCRGPPGVDSQICALHVSGKWTLSQLWRVTPLAEAKAHSKATGDPASVLRCRAKYHSFTTRVWRSFAVLHSFLIIWIYQGWFSACHRAACHPSTGYTARHRHSTCRFCIHTQMTAPDSPASSDTGGIPARDSISSSFPPHASLFCRWSERDGNRWAWCPWARCVGCRDRGCVTGRSECFRGAGRSARCCSCVSDSKWWTTAWQYTKLPSPAWVPCHPWASSTTARSSCPAFAAQLSHKSSPRRAALHKD